MSSRAQISGRVETKIGSVGLLDPSLVDRSRPGEIFSSLVESFPDAMLVADAEFEILVANQKSLQLFGAAIATGRSVFQFLGADHEEKVREAAGRATGVEAGVSIACELKRADGTRFDSQWRISAVQGPGRGLQAFLFMLENDRTLGRPEPELALLARNVAHHRWAEEALIESGERYRIVAETAIDAITTIDE